MKGKMEMRLISFGDLYLDYYFQDDLLVGVSGGKSNANILANLAPYYDTAFLGVTGNDTQGDLSKKSLSQIGVDTTNVKVIASRTKMFFIANGQATSECPYCHRSLNYHGLKFDPQEVIAHIKPDDYLIVDDLQPETLEVLNNVDNPAFIDIGYLGNMLYIGLDEFNNILADRFKIINFSERVYKVLKKKFAIDAQDLYDLLRPDILIIMRGSKGVDMITKDEYYKKEIEIPESDIESNGANAAFFAQVIRTYLESETIDDRMISTSFMRGVSLSSYVASRMGARSHLLPLYKVANYRECICQDIAVRDNF